MGQNKGYEQRECIATGQEENEHCCGDVDEHVCISP